MLNLLSEMAKFIKQRDPDVGVGSWIPNVGVTTGGRVSNMVAALLLESIDAV